MNQIRTIGIISGVVVLILVMVYFAGRWSKPKGPKRVKLPGGGDGLPAGWDPAPLSGKLKNELSGIYIPGDWGTFDSRDLALNELLTLGSDDMFVAVYNHFNSMYGEGDSLRNWILGESFIDSGIADGLEARFSTLNLL